MELISTYVRNIAVYIIFATILELVLPDSKFKEYINLLTGIILIYIIAAPLGNIMGSFSMPSVLAYRFDKSILQQEQAYYEEKQRELVLEEYKKNIYRQLEGIVSAYYTLADADIRVSSSDEAFGEIEAIYIVVEDKETTEKKKLIRIERVSVNDTATTEVEAEEAKKLKKAISDFYNLSVDNIHITVQKKDG